jgi:SAM-dependent methyltransferase
MSGTQTSLRDWANEYLVDRSGSWPFTHYEETVLELVRRFSCRKVLEIGGGRSPLFSPSDFQALGAEYTINDISQEELDAAPAEITDEYKTCFDIAGPVSAQNEYDLIYSKSVFEHVVGTMQAHRNTYQLLRPGGVSLHFYPTLFSPPFVANKLLPEKLASKMLEKFVGFSYKKFPAHYDHCRSTLALENEIKQIGYSEVVLVPFWGHTYFHRIGGLRQLDNWLVKKAEERDFRPYSSFCFALARK